MAHEMTRRQFAIAASATTLAAVGLGAPARGAEAKTLRLNITADPSQMDPITQSELIAGDILRNMYEGLTAIDRDGKIIPALATQWEPIDGGKGWRFHLRPNVKRQPVTWRPNPKARASDADWCRAAPSPP